MGGYVHTESSALTTWTVNHNLGQRFLNVEVVNSAGESLAGTYGYPAINFVSSTQLTLTFPTATAGFVSVSAGSGFTGSTGTSAVTTVYTFANLPSSVSAGARAFVSDSPFAPAGNFGQPAQSGGTDLVPVFYNGLNWIVG